ncbi:hypothetical protein Nmel_004049, partial [Mimus melanotis]
RIKQIPFLRILITYLNYNCLPKSIFKEKCTEVGKWFLPISQVPVSWGSCFDPAVTWNKHIEDKNTIIIIHEDLKGNLTANVKQIAAFFRFSPTAEQIQAIAGRHTFQPVSVKAQETYGAVGLILFRKGKFVFCQRDECTWKSSSIPWLFASLYLYLLQQWVKIIAKQLVKTDIGTSADMVRSRRGWDSVHLHPCKSRWREKKHGVGACEGTGPHKNKRVQREISSEGYGGIKPVSPKTEQKRQVVDSCAIKRLLSR